MRGRNERRTRTRRNAVAATAPAASTAGRPACPRAKLRGKTRRLRWSRFLHRSMAALTAAITAVPSKAAWSSQIWGPSTSPRANICPVNALLGAGSVGRQRVALLHCPPQTSRSLPPSRSLHPPHPHKGLCRRSLCPSRSPPSRGMRCGMIRRKPCWAGFLCMGSMALAGVRRPAVRRSQVPGPSTLARKIIRAANALL